MTTHDDELLKEIGALLDVEPSRTFDAGVRARLVAQRQRRTWLYGVVLCGTAAATLMFALSPTVRPGVYTSAEISTTPVAVAVNASPDVAAALPPVTTASTRLPASRPQAARSTPTPSEAVETRPVITSQMALLRELWSQVDSPAVLTETPVAIPAPVMEDVFVPAVVVEPVVLPVSTDVERPTLLPIIRRAVAAPQSR